jgi:hypothetical protein
MICLFARVGCTGCLGRACKTASHCQLQLLVRKGGRSTNNFHKSQICKFAELNFFLDLRTFANVAICGFVICRPYIFCELRFADPIIFCRLKTSANPQMHNFSSYKYKLKMLHSNLMTTFGFWDSFETELHGTGEV